MIVVPHYTGEAQEVARLEDLGETERGQGGFGSTGVR